MENSSDSELSENHKEKYKIQIILAEENMD